MMSFDSLHLQIRKLRPKGKVLCPSVRASQEQGSSLHYPCSPELLLFRETDCSLCYNHRHSQRVWKGLGVQLSC